MPVGIRGRRRLERNPEVAGKKSSKLQETLRKYWVKERGEKGRVIKYNRGAQQK